MLYQLANFGVLEAAIGMVSPVFRVSSSLAALSATSKVPKANQLNLSAHNQFLGYCIA